MLIGIHAMLCFGGLGLWDGMKSAGFSECSHCKKPSWDACARTESRLWVSLQSSFCRSKSLEIMARYNGSAQLIKQNVQSFRL